MAPIKIERVRTLSQAGRQHRVREELATGPELAPLPTRAQCRNGPRPCPHVRCRYHLATDVKPTGSLQVLHKDVAEMGESCALDVAERGAHTLEFISTLFGITRERTRQLEASSLDRLRRVLAHQGLSKRDVRDALAAIVSTERDMPPGGEPVYPFHKRRRRGKQASCPA